MRYNVDIEIHICEGLKKRSGCRAPPHFRLPTFSTFLRLVFLRTARSVITMLFESLVLFADRQQPLYVVWMTNEYAQLHFKRVIFYFYRRYWKAPKYLGLPEDKKIKQISLISRIHSDNKLFTNTAKRCYLMHRDFPNWISQSPALANEHVCCSSLREGRNLFIDRRKTNHMTGSDHRGDTQKKSQSTCQTWMSSLNQWIIIVRWTNNRQIEVVEQVIFFPSNSQINELLLLNSYSRPTAV